MSPRELLQEYEKKVNGHRFEEVAPLISSDGVFWFNDGSFQGIEQIRKAFEKTWSYDIQDEKYWVENIDWLVEEDSVAVCTYFFHWSGRVKGELKEIGRGRGTCILIKENGNWKIIHEHLSRLP